MNAAPPVLRAQPSSVAVQPNSSDAAASAPARAGSRDFAATLSDAGKPARKNSANKHQDSSVSGSTLPAPGNQPPLVPTPQPQAKTDAPAAGVMDAAAIVNGPAGGTQGTAPSAVAAASSPAAKAGDAITSLTSDSLDLATPLGPAAEAAPAPAPTALTAPVTGVGVDATMAPASGATLPQAAGLRIAATPATSNAARAPAVPVANPVTAILSDPAANSGTVASGNSAPSSADANAPNESALSNAPATPGIYDTAQAVAAAAAAQGTSAPVADSFSSDDMATGASGVQQGAAMLSDSAANAAAAAASVVAMAHVAAASTSAAASAATTASIAQALSASAGAGAADKRARSNGPDATLAGAATDGSVGAAQLLTSNTSTDSVPMPTFKIAAGVDTAQFGQGVADRISLMMDSNLTNAKLQVNPPALGPIEVRIALQGGHAQIWLSSHSALTRDALESSSSKLREMLGSQGFSQVSVDISQRSFQERSPQSQAYEAAPSIRADAPVLAQAPVSISRSASGLLDAYA
jgi:flagellar hook-length control protein FliK